VHPHELALVVGRGELREHRVEQLGVEYGDGEEVCDEREWVDAEAEPEDAQRRVAARGGERRVERPAVVVAVVCGGFVRAVGRRFGLGFGFRRQRKADGIPRSNARGPLVASRAPPCVSRAGSRWAAHTR
jgi:hypothetical protein